MNIAHSYNYTYIFVSKIVTYVYGTSGVTVLLMRLEELSISEWGDALPDHGFEDFHSPKALQVINEHYSGELRLFGGIKGQELVGLVPIFVREKLIWRVVTSPPVWFGVGRLGPILMPTSPKQRKRESVNKEFSQKVIKAVGADEPTTLFRMACNIYYDDPRPFHWAGFDVQPGFTYRLNLTSTTSDQLLKSFSRDLRQDIRKKDETEIMIRTQGTKGAKKVYQAMQDRYREQGTSQPISWEFIRDLLEAFEDRVRVYVAESKTGEFVSGMIVLYSNDTAYNWKGGSKPSDQSTSVSPNNLLHWRIIEDILEDPTLSPIKWYDFYTANNERLARYKSSFSGTLTPYYIIESANLPMTVAKKIYRTAKLQKVPLGDRLPPHK